MGINRKDILSAANVITLVGVGLTLVGALQLDTWPGLIMATIGKSLDNLDGYVARRWHSSSFGAALDATADKLSGLMLLAGCWYFNSVPILFVAYCFVQQALVVTLALRAGRRKLPLTVVKIGKINMFLQVSTLLLFVLSSLTYGLGHRASFSLAVITACICIPTGLMTTWSYQQAFRNKITKSTTAQDKQ